ncbi:MAG: gliding-motility protein MglA, partial [Nitrospirae bacterium]
SQIERMDANIESMEDLKLNLAEYGLELEKLPFVIQYNKRDLPNVVPVPEMNRVLNPNNVPYYEAIALKGIGVFETLKDIGKQVLRELKKNY